MQNLQLTIPEPCHENWQQMTPTDKGRFCNACAKEVIDFSMMTDTEVLNYFTALTHDKVCGRALPSQLERTISKPKDPKKRLFWYWNYIVMFFMFFGKGNNAKAQGTVKMATQQPALNKSSDINNALAGRVGGLIISTNRIINGKVTDKDGISISFASVKIKGTNGGVVADANGVYSLRVKDSDILFISGASFKSAEVPVGTTSIINTVLEKTTSELKEVVVTIAGGVMRRPARKTMTESKDTTTRIIKSTVIFEVKEDNTGLPLEKAAITITTKADNISDKILSDKKGIYEFKQNKLNDSYFVKVEAEGYESNEFTITDIDFKDRKKNWEVLLKKKKVEGVRSVAAGKIGKEARVRMGAVQPLSSTKEPLYVVDGNIVPPSIANIKPDDVDNITILQGAEAAALFGIDGANGAIVITTRKAKEIKMKELVVTSEFVSRRRTLGGMSYTNTYEDSFLGDTIATVKTLLTNSIKIYPNPVPRNTGFSVALKLKQAGNYSMQVTDASGRILLQQKFNANAKDHTEKIMGDSRWAGGVYYLRVFDNKNQLIRKTSFIFE
jgi:TonB-dependent SusC/RagA subfamily outer membrane receptor